MIERERLVDKPCKCGCLDIDIEYINGTEKSIKCIKCGKERIIIKQNLKGELK